MMFCVILFLAILEIIRNETNKTLFDVMFILITIVAVFRFGVGSDYFGYMGLYNSTPPINDPLFLKVQGHGEIGYTILVGLFKMFKIQYTIFIFFISSITMLLFYKYINENSKLKMTSLLIFYSMYYFTYINSSLRQGLALGFFLAILLPMIRKKQYIKYFIFTFLCATIHASILIVLILPFIYFDFDFRKGLIFISVSIFLSAVGIDFIVKFIPSLYERYLFYANEGFSIMAILSKIIFFVIIMLLYNTVKHKTKIHEKIMIDWYIIGLVIYIILFRQALIASREQVYFKAFEIILIPNFIFLIEKGLKKHIFNFSICILSIIMWVKEIDAAMGQSNFYNQTSILEYRYVTIFNKQDIVNYRSDYNMKK